MNQLTPTSPDQLHTFTFGQLTLRALLLESEPWFVLSDLVKALGLTSTSRVAERLRQAGVSKTHIRSGGQNREVTIIDEGNLYRVIMRSNSPVAERFESWVTDEVLPAIRKTGSYQVPQTLEERSLAIMAELTGVVAEQKALIAEMEPKADVYNRVLTPEHSFGFRQLVSALREHFPVNEADIKRVLRERGLIHQQALTATAKAIDGGWAVQRAQGNWGGKERFQARFTTKTLEWLLKELEPLEDVA